MPVVYKCPECGRTHPAPVEWDSQEEFDAVPWNQEVGAWGCEYRLRAGRRTYIQAHLFWAGEFEIAEWGDLREWLAAAREAVRRGWPGSVPLLHEIEDEVAGRRFRVVARYPRKEVVWAAYRTRAECEDYLKREGVKAGGGHEHAGARHEVVIEEVE